MRTLSQVDTLDPEIAPDVYEYAVTLTRPASKRFSVPILAETPYLAAGLAERFTRGATAIAVDGVPIVGRCVRCRSRLFETDARRLVRAGVVCEDCLWSNL